MDANWNVLLSILSTQDFRVAKGLLVAGWEEHDYERHYQPFAFPESDGGVMFERMDPVHDHHLDQWTPLEKVLAIIQIRTDRAREDQFRHR